MDWKRQVFENFRLYAVTDLKGYDPDFLAKVEKAYRGGCDIVELRSKTLTDAELLRLGIKIRKIADRCRKLFIVNDRPDLAIAAGADGVHLGQDDLPVRAARELAKKAGRPLLLGKSTHSLVQAKKAAAEKPDYVAVGPVFSTPTKPDYEPVGLGLVEKVSKQIRIPVAAIGGIDASNLDAVLHAGARRIAVVRALFSAENIEAAAAKLRERIEKFPL